MYSGRHPPCARTPAHTHTHAYAHITEKIILFWTDDATANAYIVLYTALLVSMTSHLFTNNTT